MRLRGPFLYLFVCMLLNSGESVNYSHHVVLDADGMYNLYWKLPENKSPDSRITFKIEVEAKEGCVGLGFSSDGQISGSDIVTGWIGDEEVHFQDQHADASGTLVKDDQQDYELINCYKNGTFIVLEFSRMLDTCDVNDMVINDSVLRLIAIYSLEEPLSDDQCNIQNRSVKSVVLLQNNINPDLYLDLDSLSQWNITSPGVDISNIDKLHWCRVIKSPEISKKHHIVYIKPLIQEGHEQFISYMMLYECTGGPREGFERYLDKGGECPAPQMPIEMGMCEILTTIWVPGQKDFVFPEDVGMPMDSDPPKFYRFEIYYENPQHQRGIIDSSGLMVYHTENLRQNDAGNFFIGANILPRLFIPPDRPEYGIVGHSSPECIGSSLPENGVKFHAVYLHSHLTSKNMKVRHFRGNEELMPIADTKNYDFYYPIYRILTEGVTFLRNDQISLECTYDTSQRRNVTMGGMSLTDEMCHVMVLYSPRVKEYFSLSLPTFETINNILNTNVTNDEDVAKVLSSYDWSTVDIEEVQNATKSSGHEIQCTLGPIQQKVVTTFVSYPSDLVPYETESTCRTMK